MSTPRLVFAPLLALAMSGALTAGAQPVYRCGDSYSQLPCEGARVLEPVDARTDEDRRRSESATRDARQAADRLERERLDAEARRPEAPRSNVRKKATVVTQADAPGPKKKKVSKRREPEFFTAAGPKNPKEPAKPKAPVAP